jgi:hypothetical protein
MNNSSNAANFVIRNGVPQAPGKRMKQARSDLRFNGVDNLGIPIPSNNPDDYYNVMNTMELIGPNGRNLGKEELIRKRNAALKEYNIHRRTKKAWGSKNLSANFNSVANNYVASANANAPVARALFRKSRKMRKSKRKSRRL